MLIWSKVFSVSPSETLLLEPKFCIAHLDVNLYESYRECLQFFYPRIVVIGIVLVDECNDPP
jgi:hypothetical protein